MKKIKEGKAVIKVPKVEKVSKEMEVFYNPIMKFNRDIVIFAYNFKLIKSLKCTFNY